MQIDPITVALGSTAASTTSVNGVNNFESYLNNAGNNSLASIFQKAADTYGVSVSLLTAMAKQESNFQANATSKSGAMGIMQLMPSTASYFGCTDPYDPEQNIMAGAKYISELLNKYNGELCSQDHRLYAGRCHSSGRNSRCCKCKQQCCLQCRYCR